jgi:hypothetical protein
MNAKENSDESIVPATSANNGGAEPSAESSEGRDSAKRNDVQADLLRTPGRVKRKSSGLHGGKNKGVRNQILTFWKIWKIKRGHSIFLAIWACRVEEGRI